MKPEQLSWTDAQWAAYLGCAVTDIPRFKDYVKSNYFIGIYKDCGTGKKIVEIQRYHKTPSGNVRFVPVVSTPPRSASLNSMITYANNEVIPSLELTDLFAKAHNVPTKVLHMLHISER